MKKNTQASLLSSKAIIQNPNHTSPLHYRMFKITLKEKAKNHIL